MSRSFFVAWALVAGLGCGGSAVAQDASAAPAVPVNASSQPVSPASGRSANVDDRNCVRHTGSRIAVGKNDCLPVTGRSYSGDELRRTGEIDPARALQKLDPSIRVGH